MKFFEDEYIEAVKEMTKAIDKGEILPLNVQGNTLDKAYIYNNIFCTFAEERLDW